MRHTSAITSLSWIPSEAIEGSQRLAFDAGMAHYDKPPPETIKDLKALRDADRLWRGDVLNGRAPWRFGFDLGLLNRTTIRQH